jgi:hypothetical protein
VKKKVSSDSREMKSFDFSPNASSHQFSRVSSSRSDCSSPDDSDESIHTHFVPLREIGYPSALSQIVTNLLDCGSHLFSSDDSYQCLDEVMNDMNILLREPGRFLFDQHRMPTGGLRLTVSRGQLYGREEETTILKDTFCRVASTGHSEAVFVSGFSG